MWTWGASGKPVFRLSQLHSETGQEGNATLSSATWLPRNSPFEYKNVEKKIQDKLNWWTWRCKKIGMRKRLNEKLSKNGGNAFAQTFDSCGWDNLSTESCRRYIKDYNSNEESFLSFDNRQQKVSVEKINDLVFPGEKNVSIIVSVPFWQSPCPTVNCVCVCGMLEDGERVRWWCI